MVDKAVSFPEATVRNGELRRSIVVEDTPVAGLNLSSAVTGAHIYVNGR